MKDSPKSNHEKMKAALAAKIAEAEEAARKLKIIEDYEKLMEEGSVATGNTSRPFEELTKSDAAALVLADVGKPLSMQELFDEMRKRGHGVKNVNSLRSGLSRDPKFVNMGSLKWGLASDQETQKNLSEPAGVAGSGDPEPTRSPAVRRRRRTNPI